jgi:hypothetical protein
MPADVREALNRAAATPKRAVDIQTLYRRAQRRRGRRTIVAGVTAAAVVIAVVGVTWQQTRPPTVILDSPRAPLTVESDVQGAEGFAVSVGPVRPSQHGWADHDLTITNNTRNTLYVDGHRISEMLGDKELLVGGEGCGYGGGGESVRPACRAYYRPLSIEAGGQWTDVITIYRGLQGMSQPTSDPYVLTQKIRFNFTAPFTGSGEGTADSAEIKLTYRLPD